MKVAETNWIYRPRNIGCTNGVNGLMEVIFDDGGTADIMPCRCGCGCNGMDRIPSIGETFEDLDDFYDSVNSYLET